MGNDGYVIVPREGIRPLDIAVAIQKEFSTLEGTCSFG